MELTFIAVLIMCSSFIMFLIFLSFFLGHVGILFGFDKETKITEAVIVGFITRGLDTPDDPKSASPIIEYRNEFTGETVRKELLNSGIIAQKDAAFRSEKRRVAHVGDRVKVQYTSKKVRVIDGRFVSEKNFKLSRYLIPIGISVAVGFAGFILLAISII